MQIAKVVRYRVDEFGEPFVFSTHKNGRLNFTDGQHIVLMGAGYRKVASGTILNNLRGSYEGADYHLCLEVMVEINWKKRTYRWERWYITFKEIDAGT